jgi:voltage-gated potassium channel
MIERRYGLWGSARRVFLGHFVFCSFLGLWIVMGLSKVSESLGIGSALPHKFTIAMLTGLIIAAGVWLVHHGKVRRLNPVTFADNDRAYRRWSILSGFVCGALVILSYRSLAGLLILTTLTLLTIALSVRLFFRQIARLLRPASYAHVPDVVFLLFVFATLLIAFTLVNYSIDEIYSEMARFSNSGSASDAFSSHNGSLVDYLYFSIVVMTTLGFGDISPVLPAARIAVAVQCLTSYVLFALMVGVFTRGIVFRDEEESEAGGESS